jgi:hypothetical protein
MPVEKYFHNSAQIVENIFYATSVGYFFQSFLPSGVTFAYSRYQTAEIKL